MNSLVVSTADIDQSHFQDQELSSLACIKIDTGALGAEYQIVEITGHSRKINGLMIHWMDWGTYGMDPVLFIHGAGQQARSFDSMASNLSYSYHSIAIDLRGHGNSARSVDGDYQPIDFTEDALQLMDHYGHQRFAIVGASYGGLFGMEMAALAP